MRKRVSRKTQLILSTALVALTAAPVRAQESEPPQFVTILERIVFGAGAPKVAIEVPQSVTVLDEAEFDRAQPATVGDVIAQAPGVSTVGSESRFGESLNIRGIGTGTSADEPRIVTLIDGVKKYYESYRQGSLFTDPEFFKDVEILRGPGSSTLYGSGAIGGVVAFETKDASDFLEDDDTFAVKQQLEFKSNGKGKESSTFLAFAPDQRFDGLIGFIYDDSDFLKDGAGNRIFGTRIEETNLLVKGTYSFGDDLAHSVEAGYIRYRGTADDQLLDVIDNAAFFGTVDREVVDETLYATYNYNPASDLIDLDVQLSFGSSANYVTDFQSMASTFDSDYKYEGYGLKVVNRSEWVGETTENYLTYGLELYKQDRITLRDTAGNAQFQPEGKTETVSLFAQNEWVKNDRLTVLTGARLDFQKTKPGPLVPTTLETDEVGKAFTVALHHQTTENLAFFGSASYTERLPVVDELYDSRQAFPGAANLPAVGTLENEISRNIEIGMSYTQSDVLGEGDEITMKATAFRNDLKDLIASNSAAGAGNPNRANIESALIYGVELEAAYESELSFGSLSMTVMNGENRSNPSALNPNLENRIPSDNLRLTLGRRLPARNIELGWTGTFYKGKSRAFSSMGSTNVLSAPSTMIHDVYAAWTPEEGALAGAELRLGVTNVFDKEYRTHLQSGAIRRAGRSVNLTLTKTF